ncbi:MAG TPA: amino acid permease [Thermoleophilia bacterium]|nr:amino acid permease [Thermoleophilia bacterium]
MSTEAKASAPLGGGAPGVSLADQPRTMGILTMTLFAVSAMITLDTVATSSALGVQSITLFALFALIFFVPYGLITAELGSGWPEEGGIYVWVREAFGQKWGTFTAWLYWVNVAYWAPAVFVVFAGTLAVAFWPGMSRAWEEILVIVLIWVMVLIGVLPMALSKWVNSASAVVKVAVLLMLGAMGVAFAVKHGVANSFAPGQWKPSFGANWSFLPIIIYNFMGFELMSSAAGAVKNPRRDIPRMLLFAGAIIVGAQLIGNFGILAAVPLKDLSIVSGMADAMKLTFDSVLGSAATAVYDVFIVLLLFSFIGNMVTWSIGANHSMASTGLDRSAPGVFGHVHARFKTPDYAFVLMGVLATGLTVVNYQFFATKESVFWSIFALSSIVFLFPYLLMFPSLLVLRKRQPDTPRPYTVPWGRPGAWISVVLTMAGVIFAIVLFFYLVPEGTPKVTYWVVTIGGTAISMLVGWWLAVRAGEDPGAHAAEEDIPSVDAAG